MKYNVLSGNITIYHDDGTDNYILAAFAIDPRYTKTYDIVVNNIKKALVVNAIEQLSRLDLNVSEDDFVWNNDRVNIVERGIKFNEENNTRMAYYSRHNFEHDFNDIYISLEIYKSLIPITKSSSSDFSQYVIHRNNKLREINNRNRNTCYFDILQNLKVKELLWASDYIVVPQYDWDDRGDYGHTIKSISRNLFELYHKETRDARDIMENICSYFLEREDYVDQFNYIESANSLSDLINHNALPFFMKNELNGFDTIRFEEEEGSYGGCNFRFIPIVSSYLEGE